MYHDSKKVIAHRGITNFSHENTIRSFQNAVSFGADMIEFDIRRTADGILVAFHDPFIMYLDKAVLIKDLTFDNLQRIANSLNFIVPSVNDIFKTVDDKTLLNILLKDSLINGVITNRCDRALKLQSQVLQDF